MANALDFILRLRDLLTPGMRNAAQISNASANSIQNSMGRAASSSGRMAASINELRRRLEAVNRVRTTTTIVSDFRAATREARSLERQIERLENMGKGGGFLAMLGKRILGYATVGSALAFATSSISAAMDFEVKNKTFEVLTGSITRGRGLAGQLLDLKQNTIMGTSVYGNAQTLMGFGVSDRDVVKDLRMIGDVAMGNVDRMQALTLAFSQTHAAGRLMGQDLLQYVNAGFNPLGVIAENWQQFGFKMPVTVGKLKDMMSEGRISAAAVTKAFELATSEGGRFHGMMNKISETTSGKLQLLKGHFAAFKISVGQSLQPITNQLLDFGTAVLTAMNHQKSVAGQVQDQINKIRSLQLQITSVNTSEAERIRILRELSDINPNITAGINAQAIEYGKLATNINAVVAALNQKRIASILEDKNVEAITKYNRARESSANMLAEVSALLVQINPALAERTDLSFGQKQMEAARYLREKIRSKQVQTTSYSTVGGGAAPVGTSRVTSVEQEQLTRLQNIISANQAANAIVAQLQPTVVKTQRDIKTATDAYNKLFNLSGNTGTSKTTTTSSGSLGDASGLITGTADSINRGGQRNITITIGKQIERLDIHVMGKEEVGTEIAAIVREQMVRVLSSINGNTDGGI